MSFSGVGSLSSYRLNSQPSASSHPPALEPPLSAGDVTAQQRFTREARRPRPVVAPLVPVPGTQGDADKVVLAKYIKGLESAGWTDSVSYAQTKLVDVPSNSTFGLWWQQYRDALSSPLFVQWSKEVGLNIASIRLNPRSGVLRGKFHGETKVLHPDKNADWSDVAGPILTAARALAPKRRDPPVFLRDPDAGVPLEVVGNFYGEQNAGLSVEQARARARELKKTAVFQNAAADDLERSQGARGPGALAAHQQVLAEIDDHHSVVTGQPEKSARAKADRLFAARYAAVIRSAPWGNYNAIERTLVTDIPKDSTFGQWWQLYRDSFETPQFQAWAKASDADISTLRISLGYRQVYGTFGGRDDDSVHDSYNGGSEALASVRAASVVASLSKHSFVRSPVGYPENSAPLNVVAAFFHNGVVDQTQERATSTADEIDNNPDLFIRGSKGASLTEDSLKAQQLAIGNLHDKYNVTQRLIEVEKAFAGGGVNALSTLFDNTIMPVHPNSSFGQHHAERAGQPVSLKQFIQGSGLSVPKNREQLSNLREVLGSPQLNSPEQGNYWRVLAQPLLSSTQRAQVAAANSEALGSSKYGIVDLFGGYDRSLGSRGPVRTLELLLSSEKAHAVGEALRKKLGGKSTATSTADWAAAAMVLYLDPAAGTQRNRVAGYALDKESNWGLTPQSIVSGLTQHLVNQGKVSERLAPAASRLLLAGMAPAFLVAELPSTLVYGSHAWFSFSVAVARIEKMAPGASQSMTYKEVMKFGHTQPISVSEHDMQAGAQRDAIVDWGIINGFITKRSDNVYSSGDIELARGRFNQQRAELATASDAQQAAIASRKGLALAQLKAALGNDIDFEKKSIKHDSSFSLVEWVRTRGVSNSVLTDKANARYSILELYLSDQLNQPELKWESVDPKIPFDRVKAAATSLPNIEQLYQTKVDSYSAGLKNSVALNIRNLIARLPLEDRKNFEFGTPDLYAVRGGDSGLIVRTRRTSPPTDYELFPSQKMLRKYVGLPDPLPSSDSGGHAFLLDFDAYKNGGRPQAGKTSVNLILDRVPVSGVTGTGVTSADEPANSGSVPRSFFTQHTKSLANAAAGFFVARFEAVKETSKAAKDDEQKLKTDKSLKDTLIRMIPLVAAAQDAKAGNYGEAAVDLAFDAFGFLAPELKLIEAGGSALAKLGSREVESLASSGAKGEVASSVKLGDGAGELSSVGHGINRQHILGPEALSQLVQRGDVAVGSVKAGTESVAVLAQYDQAAQKWYAYDARAGKPYGAPLSDFTPEVSAAPASTPGVTPVAPSLLEQGLSQDNIVQMGGAMQNLQLIGSEIHTFTDTYKGVNRLNIVAHGTSRDWLDKLLLNSSEVVVDGKPYNAKALATLLRSKGVDPSKYDNVRLLVCHSAEGKSSSFASHFQKEINRPVKAFEGTVAVDLGSTAVTNRRLKLTGDFQAKYPKLTPIRAQQLADTQLQREFVNKVTVKVEKRHGNLIFMNAAGVGQPPRSVLRKVTYKPRYFS